MNPEDLNPTPKGPGKMISGSAAEEENKLPKEKLKAAKEPDKRTAKESESEEKAIKESDEKTTKESEENTTKEFDERTIKEELNENTTKESGEKTAKESDEKTTKHPKVKTPKRTRKSKSAKPDFSHKPLSIIDIRDPPSRAFSAQLNNREIRPDGTWQLDVKRSDVSTVHAFYHVVKEMFHQEVEWLAFLVPREDGFEEVWWREFRMREYRYAYLCREEPEEAESYRVVFTKKRDKGLERVEMWRWENNEE